MESGPSGRAGSAVLPQQSDWARTAGKIPRPIRLKGASRVKGASRDLILYSVYAAIYGDINSILLHK
jgi:hypothetical protein